MLRVGGEAYGCDTLHSFSMVRVSRFPTADIRAGSTSVLDVPDFDRPVPRPADEFQSSGTICRTRRARYVALVYLCRGFEVAEVKGVEVVVFGWEEELGGEEGGEVDGGVLEGHDDLALDGGGGADVVQGEGAGGADGAEEGGLGVVEFERGDGLGRGGVGEVEEGGGSVCGRGQWGEEVGRMRDEDGLGFIPNLDGV